MYLEHFSAKLLNIPLIPPTINADGQRVHGRGMLGKVPRRQDQQGGLQPWQRPGQQEGQLGVCAEVYEEAGILAVPEGCGMLVQGASKYLGNCTLAYVWVGRDFFLGFSQEPQSRLRPQVIALCNGRPSRTVREGRKGSALACVVLYTVRLEGWRGLLLPTGALGWIPDQTDLE